MDIYEVEKQIKAEKEKSILEGIKRYFPDGTPFKKWNGFVLLRFRGWELRFDVSSNYFDNVPITLCQAVALYKLLTQDPYPNRCLTQGVEEPD